MSWEEDLIYEESKIEPGIERNCEEPDQEEGGKSISDYQSMGNGALLKELEAIRSSLNALIEMDVKDAFCILSERYLKIKPIILRKRC